LAGLGPSDTAGGPSQLQSFFVPLFYTQVGVAVLLGAVAFGHRQRHRLIAATLALSLLGGHWLMWGSAFGFSRVQLKLTKRSVSNDLTAFERSMGRPPLTMVELYSVRQKARPRLAAEDHWRGSPILLFDPWLKTEWRPIPGSPQWTRHPQWSFRVNVAYVVGQLRYLLLLSTIPSCLGLIVGRSAWRRLRTG